MSDRQPYEVSVPAGRLGSLIDAVHAAVRRAGARSGPKWHYGNVVGIDRLRARDLDPAFARRRYGGCGRIIVAMAVVAQRCVTVHIVFVLAADDARAFFAGAGNGTAALRAASLADFLATATRAALSAEGIDSPWQ
ncbi:hypothetical protein ACFXHA_32800 [Nocardia sp. NPDC059240]|uniref:hypothetical protein n=1 Tax=Nocardia sp. NPDC059240 TaxID=3346786 RepID=UPI0036A5C20F